MPVLITSRMELWLSRHCRHTLRSAPVRMALLPNTSSCFVEGPGRGDGQDHDDVQRSSVKNQAFDLAENDGFPTNANAGEIN